MTPYQPNWLTGVATITGYYQQVEDYEYEVSRICESFVVITGSDPFVQVMKDLVAYGNSIYKVDELGRPIVHLDLSELSDGERQQLMDSNAQSPVELVVFIPVPQGMSPFGCYSPVEILCSSLWLIISKGCITLAWNRPSYHERVWSWMILLRW